MGWCADCVFRVAPFSKRKNFYKILGIGKVRPSGPAAAIAMKNPYCRCER